MAAIKIDIKKNYEEVEIGGKVYRIDLSDDIKKKYLQVDREFTTEMEELQSVDEADLSDEQKLDFDERARQSLKKVVDFLLGDGSYDEIYEVAGRSTWVVLDITLQVSKVVKGHMDEFKNKEAEKFIGKK